MSCRARIALAAALLVPLCGCVNLHFDRDMRAEPITDQETERLVPGQSDLAQCLRALGAPRLTFEQPDRGFALAWTWRDEFDWGFSLSFTLRTFASASYRWSDVNVDQPGILVLFDDKLVAQQIRRGRMGVITKGLVRPSTDVDD